MARVILISNAKGGVGKTTTARELSAGLAIEGYNVLGVDFDPQGNFSLGCGAERYDVATSYHFITGKATFEEVIQRVNGFDIIPANSMLNAAEAEIPTIGREYKLKEKLTPIADNFDFIIIDPPPGLGFFTISGFVAATEVIIPSEAAIFSVDAVDKIYDMIKNVKTYLNRDIIVAGILLTMYDDRTINGQSMKNLTKELSKELGTEELEIPVFDQYIRSSVRIPDSQEKGINIFEYAPRSTVAEDYRAFIKEYLGKE